MLMQIMHTGISPVGDDLVVAILLFVLFKNVLLDDISWQHRKVLLIWAAHVNQDNVIAMFLQHVLQLQASNGRYL